MERREFISISAAAGACILAGGCGLIAQKRKPDLQVAPQNGTFRLDESALKSLAEPGSTLAVAVEGRGDKVLVFRRPDGQLQAVSMRCPHLGCDVDYESAQDLIVCPCHGSEFAPDGTNRRGPAKRPLHSYEVQSDGQGALVRLDA